MRKVERIARGRTRRAESALMRQVYVALDGLRRDQSQAWLDAGRAPVIDSLPARLAQAQATVRRAFLSGYKDGKAMVSHG